ncbi:putative PKS/NRPS-like protein biosynthetic cluster [Diaporthe australafricana]|uniref:PKS/NRPS-like protein biosynthetic cluster n=1 Tax=Diaporthe australafricana TaxID=127596 RepID=A0ABR3Y3D2_9PEZI
MWDAEANGYARGEGVAAIVLKTLEDALKDGDEIECVIRDTWFAQDGRTQGITSPNPAAQTQMIRDCYLGSGLDPTSPLGRPQFFECHGTGTGAGDAAEAEAIANSFFPSSNNEQKAESATLAPLFVGSVKSIIGHTEGTAGVAGVLKAALALRNSTIPANLLFNKLNPRIKPFYHNVQVATTTAPWPSIPAGSPRRASVNSFGFGGANVHAILESYDGPAPQQMPSSTPVYAPFVFSAFSSTSLSKYLVSFRDYLLDNRGSVPMRDLAFTLHSRRSCLNTTIAITASDEDELYNKIAAKLYAKQRDGDHGFVSRSSARPDHASGKPSILGIFTGQGAQWAAMGCDLISVSKNARQVLERMESRLSRLPETDRPTWSLIEELQKGPESSRIGEAAFSQPLCTAIQILQVDILQASGVVFSAVVGHSSGEIAAAYAAGFLTAEAAICIAYYRGLYAKLAGGMDGKSGAMLAAGTSAEDARELCDDPDFKGRACVAAINSSVSVTLSGDHDAVQKLKVILEDEHKFARMVKVDKAYHSHHMEPCTATYLASLAELDLEIGNGDRSIWFSSVLAGEIQSKHRDSIKGSYWNSNMANPVLFHQAVAGAVNHIGHPDLVVEIGPHPALKGPVLQTIQDLYPGKETLNTGFFQRGVPAIQSIAEGMGYMWMHLGNNVVDLQSYDTFLSGHTSHSLVKGLPSYAWDHREFWHESRYAQAIRLRPGPVHELLGHKTPDSQEQDMRWRHILRPTEMPWLLGHRIQGQVVFPGAGYVVTALEASMAMCRQLGLSVTLIQLSDLQFGRALLFDTDDTSIEVIISVSDIKRPNAERLEASFSYHAADGKGDTSLNLISTASVDIVLGQPDPAALPVKSARQPNLTRIRIEDFYDASREIGYQWGGPFIALDNVERKLGSTMGNLNVVEMTPLLVHPATLDAAFQAVLLAYSYPDDGQLWTVHVPRNIRRVTFNPLLCARQASVSGSSALPFSACHHPDTKDMIGNVDVYTSDSKLPNAMIQVEDLECVPFTRATSQDDKEAFAVVAWDLAFPDIEVARARIHPNEGEDQKGRSSSDTQTPSELSYSCLAQVVKQIIHRSPKLHFLELGGQEMHLCQAIIGEIGTSFSSYTLTNVESEAARSLVSHDQVLFRALDIRQNPMEQGFSAAAYDAIILENVFGSGSDAESVLRNIRALLKPGGFLLAINSPTSQEEDKHAGFILENKPKGDFDAVLRRTGFSGFGNDMRATFGSENSGQSLVWMTQALDDKIPFLRNPMASDHWSSLPGGPLMKHLVIVGGATVDTKPLAEEIRGLLQQFCVELTTIDTLTDLQSEIVSLESTVLCLAELDRPVFEDLKPTQWECIKKVTMEAGSMLWVTRGRRSEVPLSNIIVGLMRSITREIFTINHQILDFECASGIQARTIAGALLKFRAETIWRQHDSSRAPLETELVVDEEGRLLIPRLKVDDEMNARYNALKRPIARICKTRDHCIEVVQGASPSGYELRKVPTDMVDVTSKQQISVTYSLLSTIRVTEFCSLFPMIGKHKESGKDTFALSAAHNSIADIRQGLCVEVDIPSGAETTFLSLAVCHILSWAIFRGLSSGDVVLVNEPTLAEAEVLTMEAQRIGVDISFSTSSMTTSRSSSTQNWIAVHPAATERSISRLLPGCVSVFVDLSRIELPHRRSRIGCLLPNHCRRESLKTLFPCKSQAPKTIQFHELKECVTHCAAQALSMLGGKVGDATLPTIAAGSLANTGAGHGLLTILDWNIETELTCQLQPIDTQVRFSPEKTYWLVGLSRGLGLALCEWMMRRGARYFAISSRKPAIDAAWLQQMHDLGAVIRVCPCDVNVRQQVDEVFQDICKTMPPIAGVAQGSMVLEDKAIREMTHESFLRGTDPKVRGSIHLNDCFQSNTLDFFIFFSSVVAVIGRPGQSNYSSGNCFMASLAEQRRRRGLAGSVVHIGPIYGIGYASRLEKAIYSRANFRSTALIPTSERDFYQLFAEAVVAGRPSSSRHSIEILNGVKRVGPHDKDRPVWEAEPLMSHFVKNRDEHSFNAEENLSKLPLKAQLAEASDRGQVTAIIREAFLPKVCSIFQLDTTKISQETLLGMRLDEIGIDSLLAVDIRSWFMKSLEVNIPVLKILSGVAIGDLINIASEKVPERLLPSLDTHGKTTLQLGLQNESDSPVDTATAPVPEEALGSSDPRRAISGDIVPLGSDEKESFKNMGPDTTSSARNQRRTHELSFGQEMFWFVWSFIEDKTSLNHVAFARITGDLDIDNFQKAVDLMRHSHETLRTAIVEDQGRPLQSIMDAAAWKLEVRQIESVDDVNTAVKQLQNKHVYDVSRGQTVRAMLLSTSPDEHFFVAGLHPLVADGMSFQSLITGVQKLYSSPHECERYAVRQFAEFSDAQHFAIKRGEMRDELAFWKSEFQSLPMPLPILTLSRCISRPPLTVYENVLATFRVRPETKRQIQALCRRYRVTPFHFYLATFRVLLLRFAPTGDGEDVCIGVGDANRTDNSLMDDIIGPLVNLLPLRLRTQGSATFSQLLQQTRDNAYKALAHSKLPFQALLKE